MANLLNILVVGGGRLGATLARDLAQTGQQLTVVVRQPQRALAVSNWLKSHHLAANLIADLPTGTFDVVLAAVPDAQLVPLAQQLAKRPALSPIYLHLSGVAPARQLAHPSHAAVACGSLHPLAAVADPLNLRDPTSPLPGALMAVGGDAPALAMATQLSLLLGGLPQVVADAQRPAYHAAAALIANDWVALALAAEETVQAAGLTHPGFRAGLLHLAKTALAALQRVPADTTLLVGLTGAVSRGVAETLTKHFKALQPDTAALHRQASQLLAERSAQLHRLSPEQLQKITEVLRSIG